MLAKKRPINLDLTTMKFPPMAIVSILHRLSGIALFILLPVMLCFLSQSLQGKDEFQSLQLHFMDMLSYKIVTWVFCTALIYHLLAGIRHLIMDLGYGEDVKAGRCTAIIVIITAAVLSLCLGIWIW